MTENVTQAAREAASRLAELFDQDQQLAIAQKEALDRLRAANDRLWDGLHPDGMAAVYDGATPVAGSSELAELAGDETRLLAALQQTRWAIHRAMWAYQQASEDRRCLAADVGAASARLVSELVAAGWSEDEARSADVHQLAAATTVGA